MSPLQGSQFSRVFSLGLTPLGSASFGPSGLSFTNTIDCRSTLTVTRTATPPSDRCWTLAWQGSDTPALRLQA